MSALRFVVVGLLLALGSAPAFAEPAPAKIVELPHGLEAMLMQGAYRDLDKLADGYRATHARAPGGAWALSNFYFTIAQIAEGCGPCLGVNTDIGFDAKSAALERWLVANPRSLTARIALARLWLNYAWAGRGAAPAQQTSPSQLALLNARAKRALDRLSALDANADPEIYELELEAAPVAADPRETLETTYERAARAFPDFPDYAATKFTYLLERWYGRPGEAQAFTRALIDARAPDGGRTAYYAVAATALGVLGGSPEIYDETGLDYPTLVKAFATRTALYGAGKYEMNVLMAYAVAAWDKKTTAFLADKIGEDWYPSVWRAKAKFDAAIAWSQRWL